MYRMCWEPQRPPQQGHESKQSKPVDSGSGLRYTGQRVAHMMPLNPSPSVNSRQCPTCGESIQINAKECRHCGQTITEIEHAKPLITNSAASSRWLKRTALGAVLIGVITLVAWTMKNYIRQSDLWVSLHSDVMWHRDWQDRQLAADRPRTIDLYERFLKKHPDNGDWAYLAIRTLPDGAEKRRRFEESALKFTSNQWILWGIATSYSLQEDRAEPEQAAHRYIRAIEAFGQQVPGVVMGHALASYASLASSEEYENFYKKHANLINHQGEAARGMAIAEWSLGHLRSALRWEAKAEDLGATNGQQLRNASLVMGAVNIRENIVGSHGACLTGSNRFGAVPDLEVTNFAAKDEGESYFLIFWLNYLAFEKAFDGMITRDDIKLYAVSGAKYDPWKGTTAVAHVTAGKNTPIVMTYSIPKTERVSKLVLDTKRSWKDSDDNIILEVHLEPEVASQSATAQIDDGSIYPN